MPYTISDEQLESLKNATTAYEINILLNGIETNGKSTTTEMLPNTFLTMNRGKASALEGLRRIHRWLNYGLSSTDYNRIPQAPSMLNLARDAIEFLDSVPYEGTQEEMEVK